jgi:cold-inducible RNA-binding protein
MVCLLFLNDYDRTERKDAMPRLFFGNIPHGSSGLELQQWVESRGFQVESVEIIYDRMTGKPRGFGFVTLRDGTNLQTAIGVLNGRRMDGRVLTVNEATPLTSRAERLVESKPTPTAVENPT